MTFMRLRLNYIIGAEAVQGEMLILLEIIFAHLVGCYRRSGKLGKIMHKLYTGCINCTKHADPFTCPEKAMIRRVRERNL